jgi:hypothetical protein
MVQIGDALRHQFQCGRVSLIILLMIYHNKIRDCMHLLCQALVQPSQAPWRKLFEHGDENSFLHMTGLMCEAFRALLDYLLDLNYLSCYCCRGRVGYNQIKTVFDPEYTRILNHEGYERIAQYYFCPGDYDSKVDGSGSDSGNNNE